MCIRDRYLIAVLHFLKLRGEFMTKKEIAVNAVHALKKEYPDAICSLVYTDPLQMCIRDSLVRTLPKVGLATGVKS